MHFRRILLDRRSLYGAQRVLRRRLLHLRFSMFVWGQLHNRFRLFVGRCLHSGEPMLNEQCLHRIVYVFAR